MLFKAIKSNLFLYTIALNIYKIYHSYTEKYTYFVFVTEICFDTRQTVFLPRMLYLAFAFILTLFWRHITSK